MDLGTSKATIITVRFLLTQRKNATRNESLKKGNGRRLSGQKTVFREGTHLTKTPACKYLSLWGCNQARIKFHWSVKQKLEMSRRPVRNFNLPEFLTTVI